MLNENWDHGNCDLRRWDLGSLSFKERIGVFRDERQGLRLGFWFRSLLLIILGDTLFLWSLRNLFGRIFFAVLLIVEHFLRPGLMQLRGLLFRVDLSWHLLHLSYGISCRRLRASSSICLNLAEGWGKQTPKDRKKFFQIAFGSTRECQSIIDLHPLNETSSQTLNHLAASLFKLIKLQRSVIQSAG